MSEFLRRCDDEDGPATWTIVFDRDEIDAIVSALLNSAGAFREGKVLIESRGFSPASFSRYLLPRMRPVLRAVCGVRKVVARSRESSEAEARQAEIDEGRFLLDVVEADVGRAVLRLDRNTLQAFIVALDVTVEVICDEEWSSIVAGPPKSFFRELSKRLSALLQAGD